MHPSGLFKLITRTIQMREDKRAVPLDRFYDDVSERYSNIIRRLSEDD